MIVSTHDRKENQDRRLRLKTQDARLANMAVHGAGLSPWESDVLVQMIQEVYFSNPADRPLGGGQLRYECVAAGEGAGKPIADCRLETVVLSLLGISSIGNVLAAIKTARWFELTGDDVIVTVATDSSDLYCSRLGELTAEHGPYTAVDAARDLDRRLRGQRTDFYQELTHPDRRAIHNLKYYTWVEQQEMDVADLESLWYDRDLWPRIFAQPARWDAMIAEFNAETGVLAGLES